MSFYYLYYKPDNKFCDTKNMTYELGELNFAPRQ